MEQTKRKKRNCINYKDETVCKALTKTSGMLSAAAKLLDKSPAWMSEKVKEPAIKEHLSQVSEERIDKYESALDSLRDLKNPTSILFFLKTKGRSRGYVEHAPIEETDPSRFKALTEFFSAFGKAPEKRPAPKSDEPASPDSSPVKTVRPDSNFP